MDLGELALLAGSGVAAGIVNTVAGGGSLLTVPLLVLFGLPGGVANGTNRLGVLIQSVIASGSFRAHGILEFRSALRVIAPLAAGSLVGAVAVTRLADAAFERSFGVVMLLLLVPTYLRRSSQASAAAARPWSPLASAAMYGLIGVYAGAFQAGVGLLLLLALSHAGFDLVRANAVKVMVVAVSAAVSVPVFFFEDQISWWPALVLSAGLSVGAALGARLAVRGGERVIRPIVAIAVVGLALTMLGVL
ncbi:MAG: sulfite exporter TauE/SafE family protein [Myxococcota bacterium]